MEIDNSTHKEQPEVAMTPFELVGEPKTDKGYVDDTGQKMRVRVVIIDEKDGNAPISNGEVAPTGITLSITIAALNDDNSVKLDAEGRLLITDTHEIVIDEGLKNEDFDPKAAVDAAIRQQGFVFKQQMANRTKITNYLKSTWGSGVKEND